MSADGGISPGVEEFGNTHQSSARQEATVDTPGVVLDRISAAEGPLPDRRGSDWHRSLTDAVRDVDVLFNRLGLPEDHREAAQRAATLFPLLVTESFLLRMTQGDPYDPLLRQVLPLDAEFDEAEGFTFDAVGDEAARRAPGLLHKYAGRALLIATGSCAVHCRYCFRRHYPYGEEPRRLDEWDAALEVISEDESLHEIILSGGDPLMLTDTRLEQLVTLIADVPHVRRLRVHSRLPIVLPDRVTDRLIDLLMAHDSLTPIMVVHANHPAEVVNDCAAALKRLVTSGITTLNQAVLLRGVNDNADIMTLLSERLINLGVMPYYLHQLDRVQGTAHFEVPDAQAIAIIDQLRASLPGYAVPRLVREMSGEHSKSPVT
ncbi:MAG: EF-P beta-lysylation protein EpmB [Planctomycetaceae bacterium]